MDIFHVFTILIILFFPFASLTIARNVIFQEEEEGITLDLIHRDSPISPLYDPSRSRFNLIRDAFERSKYRVSSMKKTSSSHDIQFQLNRIPGEYIMELSIGTPPFKIQGIIDTLSDFTWTPCDPRPNINYTIPVFNPVNSKSYKILSCNSSSNTPQCLYFNSAGTSCYENQCFYETMFFQHIDTDSEGQLSADTFTFESLSTDKSISIKNFVFGCGDSNGGGYINGSIWGHFSLSNGPLSIVNQLKQKKFSYCLVPSFSKSNITSKINFGSSAIAAGPGTVTLPLYETSSPPYCVRLEAIKVDNKIISYKPFIKEYNISIEQGTAHIDTGLTSSYFPCEFLKSIKKEIKAAIAVPPSQEDCGLCYKITPQLKLPTITLSFAGGDIVLPASSTFVEEYKGQVCLAFDSIGEEEYGYEQSYIKLGNLVQENFLVGYDLVKNQVSFKPTDCTKQ